MITSIEDSSQVEKITHPIIAQKYGDCPRIISKGYCPNKNLKYVA